MNSTGNIDKLGREAHLLDASLSELSLIVAEWCTRKQGLRIVDSHRHTGPGGITAGSAWPYLAEGPKQGRRFGNYKRSNREKTMSTRTRALRNDDAAFAEEVDEANFRRSAKMRREDPHSCSSYERLVAELDLREPTPEDFDFLVEHEEHCPNGTHTEAGVEKALGLPDGALRNGSPEHGLLPPRVLVERLIAKHLKG